MPLSFAGQIAANDVNIELTFPETNTITLNDTAVRNLAAIPLDPYPASTVTANIIFFANTSGFNSGVAAIDANNKLLVWGNYSGVNQAIKTSVSPVQIGNDNWSKIAMGYGTNYMGIKSDGTLWSWGSNVYGVLGLNDQINRSSPVQVGTKNTWTDIVGGWPAFYAIESSNSVYGIGSIWINGLSVHRSSPTFLGFANTAIVSTGKGIGNIPKVIEYDSDGLIKHIDNANSGFTFFKAGGIFTNWLLNDCRGNTHSVLVKKQDDQGRAFVYGTGDDGQLGNSSVFSTTTGLRTNIEFIPSYDGDACYAVGYDHTLIQGVILSSRTTGNVGLYVTGNNNFGQLGTNSTANSNSFINVGTTTAVSTTTQKINSQYKKLVAGYKTSFGILSGAGNNNFDEGKLFAWGLNNYGQLGQSDTIDRSSPVQIDTSNTGKWKTITTCNEIVAAIKMDGSLWTWGKNDIGQLGINDIIHRSSPVLISAPLDLWSGVKAGLDFFIAQKQNGTLYVWGNNSKGQLGLGDTVHRSSPTQLSVPNTVIDFAATKDAIAYIVSVNSQPTLANTELYTCGGNDYGQLGKNDLVYRSSPTLVGSNSRFLKLYSANYEGGFYCLLKKDRNYTDLYAWGNNNQNQLGNYKDFNYTTNSSRSSPTFIGNLRIKKLKEDPTYYEYGLTYIDEYDFIWFRGLDLALYSFIGPAQFFSTINSSRKNSYGNWKKVATHPYFSMAIDNWGNLFGCGYNYNGILTDMYSLTNAFRSQPAQIGSYNFSRTWSDIQLDKYIDTPRAFALTTEGNLYTWGNDLQGNLGLNSTNITRSQPTLVGTASTRWLKAVPGASAAGIRTDGTLWVWGHNTNGQLGLNNTIHRSSPVQLGSNTWIDIAVGAQNSAGFHIQGLGVQSDGTLYAWGYNNDGQLGLYDTIHRSNPVQIGTDNDWVKVFSRGSSSYAIKRNGTLWAWGSNVYGQLGLLDLIHRSSPVQVGFSANDSVFYVSSCLTGCHATTQSGNVWAWGTNHTGFLNPAASSSIVYSSPVNISTSPGAAFSAIKNVAFIDSGGSITTLNSFVIDNQGSAWSWGYNVYGSLANNTINASIERVNNVLFTDYLQTTNKTFVNYANLPETHFKIAVDEWRGGVQDFVNYYPNTLSSTAAGQLGFYVLLTPDTSNKTIAAESGVSRYQYWGSSIGNASSVAYTVYRSSPTAIGSGQNIVQIEQQSWRSDWLPHYYLSNNSGIGILQAWGDSGSGTGGTGSLGNFDFTSRSSPVSVSAWTTVLTSGAFQIPAFKTNQSVISMNDLRGKGSRAVQIQLTVPTGLLSTGYDLYTNRGPTYNAGNTEITLTVEKGQILGTPTSSNNAIGVPSAFHPKDKIKIVNYGYIVGAGGGGGPTAGANGNLGRGALLIQRPVIIDNQGTIAGGGGGGGSGSPTPVIFPRPAKQGGPSPITSAGGGGGGGAGYLPGPGGGPPGITAGIAGTLTAAGSGTPASPTQGNPGGPGGSLGSSGTPAPVGGTGGSAGYYIQGLPFVYWANTGTRLGPSS